MTEQQCLTCEDASKMLDFALMNNHLSAGKLKAFVAATGVRLPSGVGDSVVARYAVGQAIRVPQPMLGIPDNHIVQQRQLNQKVGRHLALMLRDIVGNPFRAVELPWNCLAGCGCQRSIDGGRSCHACGGRVDCPWRTPQVLDLAQAAWDDIQPEYGTQLDLMRLMVLADALEEAGCPLETEVACPRCLPYHTDNSNPWETPGYHPERDPASGKHEGGWTNCQDCNSAGNGRPGFVLAPHPLLAHLRSPGPHVRGCWAVDLLLGKGR